MLATWLSKTLEPNELLRENARETKNWGCNDVYLDQLLGAAWTKIHQKLVEISPLLACSQKEVSIDLFCSQIVRFSITDCKQLLSICDVIVSQKS